MEPALTKKLLLQKQPKQRISNEAIVTANELLRLFVVEARQRASIEAECEDEAVLDNGDSLSDDDEHGSETRTVKIRADHITKIAAELLMDFS
jgi:vacuolar-type H+-ATPase subunit H